MNDDAEKLKAFLADPDGRVDEAWLDEMKERYPFFQLPQAMKLREECSGMDAEERSAAVEAMVLSMSDSEAAEALFDGPEGSRFAGFYPPGKSADTPSTISTIDKFLATYGTNDSSETETLEKLIFNPVADYSQQLAREEESSVPQNEPTGNSQDDRINRFILSVRSRDNGVSSEQRDREVKAPEPAPDNTLLSESLAKIYIKTRHYERAYEILNRLSLDFPEKNAYFADQLRFLRKLMLAESIRKKRIDNENRNE